MMITINTNNHMFSFYITKTVTIRYTFWRLAHGEGKQEEEKERRREGGGGEEEEISSSNGN